jgi:carnosine N-methyltransferase
MEGSLSQIVSAPGFLAAQEDLICLHCRQALELESLDVFVCRHCHITYPLPGGIPVLLKDSSTYISGMFSQYSRHLLSESQLVKELEISAAKNPRRKNMLLNWKQAIDGNSLYIKEIQDTLQKSADINQLASSLLQPSEISYATGFDYLRRDWCWLPEGEQEIEVIEQNLESQIARYAPDFDNVLIIGAGAGRVAWDMRKLFSRVYAMDKSFLMAHQFHRLFKEDIRFFEINTKNLMHNGDGIRMHRASLLSPWESEQPLPEMDTVNYFVGDALSVPIRDHSLSCILSVYFTDLVPLHSYLQEIKRLLKPGGLFIHFGPLDYHFENLTDRLSANEIRAEFSAAGFSWGAEKEVISTHLKSSVSMVYKTYKNWMFSAIRKPDTDHSAALLESSVIRLKREVLYETKGSITVDRELLKEVNIVLPAGDTYQGADSVLDIIRLVDGQKTISEVVDMLATEYDLSSQSSRREVMEIIRSLIDKEIIQIIPTC